MTVRAPTYDPKLVEIVEKTLEPYKRRFSPELVEHMREEALMLMSTHPYPVALLETLTPAPAPEEISDEREKGGPAAPRAPQRRIKGGGRGPAR